jgi:phage tail protein X
MDRYTTNLQILNTNSGKRYLSTVMPNTIDVDATFSITHYAGENDRLDSLAYRYYGSVTLWWVIAKANGLANGTITIKPGTKLLIPRLNA